MRRFVLTLALLLVAARASAAEAPLPPAPERWVTDNVGFISPEMRARLDARLEGYQRSTGHQVVVWIGDSIGGLDLADWAVRTFAQWKVGRKGIDDGVVMFVLAGDKKIDIEVGYGLEGQVTDAKARQTIDDMAERIRAGDRDGAVSAGVESILTAIEGKPVPGDDSVGQYAPRSQKPRPVPLAQKIIMGILALAFLVFFITNPRLAMLMLWSVMARGGGGYGGGGWGGGGGGFGGGGGRSGGGGARGGW
jgi:uncharacterized protein